MHQYPCPTVLGHSLTTSNLVDSRGCFRLALSITIVLGCLFPRFSVPLQDLDRLTPREKRSKKKMPKSRHKSIHGPS